MGLIDDNIAYFLKYTTDKYLDTSIGRSSFISLCEGLKKVVEDSVSGFKYDIDYKNIVDNGFNEVFKPIIIPLLDIIDNYRKALENQIKYGTKITITTEQMNKLIKDNNINKED